MGQTNLHLLLADDDTDDCDFFNDAVDEISDNIKLSIVDDGVQLMGFLKDTSHTPDLIFLDLNMPKKSGMECISEIKSMDRLSQSSIIIYSTSLDQSVVSYLRAMGADHYIQKPAEFKSITSVISKAIALHQDKSTASNTKDNFIIHP